MDFQSAFAISASGLHAQQKRLHTVASNLANIESTRTPEGGPYRRRDVIFAAVPAGDSFGQALQSQIGGIQPYHGVEVTETILDSRPFKKIYQPEHPDAGPEGFVLYPNINLMEETVNMISVLRAYEANVTAMSATKSMGMKLLELIR